ncbi:replication factor A protein 2 [Trapelia coarctata]|nr:replication factor A protein 2 [Trapelia coarctata]
MAATRPMVTKATSNKQPTMLPTAQPPMEPKAAPTAVVSSEAPKAEAKAEEQKYFIAYLQSFLRNPRCPFLKSIYPVIDRILLLSRPLPPLHSPELPQHHPLHARRYRRPTLSLHKLTLLKHIYGKDTLRPLTILQVLTATHPHPDAEFSIEGTEITQITFVGQIRNVSSQATNMTYKLDDGTGTIEVKQWIDADAPKYNELGDPIAGKGELKIGEWARVWGRLKAFNNKRHVGAHVIRAIHDKNEINYHLLEATAVHLYFTRGPPDQFTQNQNQNQLATNADAYGQAAPQSGYNQQGAASMPNLSVSARKVIQCLKNTPQNNEGLHMQQIAGALAMGIPEVMKAGDELMSHSLIFTTVDDNTWALLEM